MRIKNAMLFLVILFLTACAPAPQDQSTITVESYEEKALPAYPIAQFLQKIEPYYDITFQEKTEMNTETLSYLWSDSVYAIEIKNPGMFIANYADFFEFVKQELQKDAAFAKKAAQEKQDSFSADKFEIYYDLKEVGLTEDVAIEEVFKTIYIGREEKVVGVDLEKWFYFYCAPNIIVKAKARKDTGWTNFNFVGDKEAAIAYLEEQAIDFDNGIGKYRYDANSRAMRNVLCPKLASNFNEGFQRLSESGQI